MRGAHGQGPREIGWVDGEGGGPQRSLRGLRSKRRWDWSDVGTGGGGGGRAHTHKHTLIPAPRPESPACTRPDLQASLPLYSSTSARFPSSALPFNRMSLSSGDMK